MTRLPARASPQQAEVRSRRHPDPSDLTHLVHHGDRQFVVTGRRTSPRTLGPMGSSKGSSEYRALQRERERRRRRQPRRAASEPEQQASETPVPDPSARRARRAAATACGWCGGPITLRSRGPIQKWCSATCRHRAWEQARAAASGRAAVQVVERIVVTPAATPLVATPQHDDWIASSENWAVSWTAASSTTGTCRAWAPHSRMHWLPSNAAFDTADVPGAADRQG
jgi:hypothetical protein